MARKPANQTVRRSVRGKPTASSKHDGMRREDFEDEIDDFHKERDKIMLESDGDEGIENESEEEAIFNIQGADESSEDDEEDEEGVDEAELTGLAAKLAKQAKIMRQKTGGVAEEDSDFGEEEEGEEEEKSIWGKNKKAYYSADNLDYEIQSDDEETPFEEEREVLRLQKKLASGLKPEDYEQEEAEEADGQEEVEEEGEMTMGERAKGKGGKSKQENAEAAEELEPADDVAVEEVKKDASALSQEQQMEVVMSEAPELVGLLSDLKQSLSELRDKVQPLLEQMRTGGGASSAAGLSYLESKNLGLLSYCSALCFCLLLRAEGRGVRDHPVIPRLMELRLYLEKIRPIDKKLQYQIEKLLRLASSAEKGPEAEGGQGTVSANGDAPPGMTQEEALRFRPNPDLLVSKLDPEQKDGTALYRPPKLAPVSMEDERPPAEKRREQFQARQLAQRSSRTSFVRQLAAELEGRPEEEGVDLGVLQGSGSRAMAEERERLRRRAEEEERMFARVPLRKEERKRLRGVRQGREAALSGLLEDFEDEVGGFVGLEEGTGGASGVAGAPTALGGPPEGLLKRRRLSQAVAEAGRRGGASAAVVSGDADLPSREDLGERRKALEQRTLSREYKKVRFDNDDKEGEEDDAEAFQGEPEEDDVYRSAKEGRAARLAEKRGKYVREGGNVPREVEVVEGKRAINRDIEKNRGLTPHRNKLVRNPRKKYKVAHAKAVVRRKGQVRGVEREMAPYAGQATGIKSNVTRSVRLNK